jgi:membrane associated rhomboid family serine protease
MGLADRDYYRDEPRGVFLGGDRSMVANLIIVNVVLFVLDALFFDGRLMRGMALKASLFEQPWDAWQMLTYGFAHAPNHIWHIIFNMLGLWFFGRDVEGIYGRKVFLQLYLTLLLLSGVCWLATSFREPNASVLGASGAVFGVMLVFVMHYPHRTVLLFGVLPVPAWFLMAGYLIMEFSALQSRQDYIAHTAHLGGALFGFVFYKTGWTLFSFLPGKLLQRGKLARRPKLKLHAPEQDDDLLAQRVDEILEKISRVGEASLTKEERRVLEDASRRYQKRRS